MSPFFASYLASIAAIILTIILIFSRTRQLVAFFKPQTSDLGQINSHRIRVWGTVFGIIINLMFALVAAVIYGYFIKWFADLAAINFAVTAFSFVFLFTVLAVITRREGLLFEKIVINMIFGIIYGVLIPLLVY